MTVSSEAKRTLVKSPPELWSEVSDAESLARHLDGVQQIKITRIEPETAVEWEADGARGSVRLQPSGFGTKVTLSLSRELPSTEAVAPECEPDSQSASEDAPDAPPEPVADAEPEPLARWEPLAEPADTPPANAEPDRPVSEPAITQTAAEPAEGKPDEEIPREGFFARLFKRRRKPIASAGTSTGPACEPQPVALAEPEPVRVAEPEPMPVTEAEPEAVPEAEEQAVALAPEPVPEPADDPVTSVIADLATLEAEMAKQDEAMLTAMLDRLGAAHHRPFSRS